RGDRRDQPLDRAPLPATDLPRGPDRPAALPHPPYPVAAETGGPPVSTLALSVPSGLFGELDRRQPLLARAGWVSLLLLLLCLAAMAADARLINGVSVWTKPAKFAASFVAWFWTLAWAWGLLDPGARRGAAARVVLWGTLA